MQGASELVKAPEVKRKRAKKQSQRSTALLFCLLSLSLKEKNLKKIAEASTDDSWVIGTKWVTENKRDVKTVVVGGIKQDWWPRDTHRKKEKVLDYDEVFAPVAELKPLEQGTVFGRHLYLFKDKYVAEILKKFDLVNVKAAITPMETKMPLTKDEEAFDVDVHLYRSMIGNSNDFYLNAVKVNLQVCSKAQTQTWALWFPRESPFDLEAFSDSDYGGSNLDRKSTTGGCQFLGQRPYLMAITATANTNADGTLEIKATIDTISTSRGDIYCPHHFSPQHEHAPSQMPMDDLLHKVPKLISRIDSLEMDLKLTKLTMGNAIVKLVKKVKKMERVFEKGNLVSILDFQEDVDAGVNKLILLEIAEQVNTASAEQVSTAEGVNTSSIKLSTGDKKLSTGNEQGSTVGAKKSTSDQDKGQREGKAPMISEETPKKSKKQVLQEEASLAEAIRLDTLQREEVAKQVHLDSLLAQRIAEEELSLKMFGEELQTKPQKDECDEARMMNQSKKWGKMEGNRMARKGCIQVLIRNDSEDIVQDVSNLYGVELGQQKIISWRYYESCRVHCLNLESMDVYMLIERSYPLSAEMCKAMLDKKLQGGKPDENCYKMLKMMERQWCGGGDDSSGVVTVVAKVAAGWWRPRWCGDCEGSGGEVVMVACGCEGDVGGSASAVVGGFSGDGSSGVAWGGDDGDDNGGGVMVGCGGEAAEGGGGAWRRVTRGIE
ncbi:hypothetical protein Tco_1054488 [Tanacetum coccineum]|uniref:Uncharacterized protein n=1 Tax=Tanacetum coccineum TaxID=301880 RepID=A0ABQ5GWW8_9ASTR